MPPQSIKVASEDVELLWDCSQKILHYHELPLQHQVNSSECHCLSQIASPKSLKTTWDQNCPEFITYGFICGSMGVERIWVTNKRKGTIPFLFQREGGGWGRRRRRVRYVAPKNWVCKVLYVTHPDYLRDSLPPVISTQFIWLVVTDNICSLEPSDFIDLLVFVAPRLYVSYCPREQHAPRSVCLPC